MRGPIIAVLVVSLLLTSTGAMLLTAQAAADPVAVWKITTIDTQGDVGQYCSLEVDANGTYFISYYDATNRHLKYATNQSGSATNTTLDATDGAGVYTSLEMDVKGRPHISYESVNGRYLFYIENLSGSWVRTAATMNSQTNNFTSLVVDGNQKAYIGYFTDYDQSFYYACNSDGTWRPHFIYQFGDVGRYVSLALDPQRRVYASFFDATNGDLRFNYNFFGNQADIVDSDGTVGEYTSIDLDGRFDPQPFISYYDVTKGDLKLAYKRWDTRQWNTYAIDSADDVGKFTSLRVEADTTSHIAYYDVTNGDLKYAVWDKGNIEISRIDSPGNVGQFASLALDGKGRPSIAYYDATNGDLKLATLSSPGESRPQVYGPEAPTGINAALVGNNSIQVTWNSPQMAPSDPPVTGYRLFVGTGDSGVSSRTILLGNVTQYLDPDLEYSTIYDYWVTAINANGEGNASAIVNATTAVRAPDLMYRPLAPAILPSVSAGYTTTAFSWSPPSVNSTTPSVTGYKIYRGYSNASLALIATIGNVTSYSDSSLQQGVLYLYAVAALNSQGEGVLSPTMGITTQVQSAPSPSPPATDYTPAILVVLAILAIGAAIFLLHRRK
jgi:hypothetical protein